MKNIKSFLGFSDKKKKVIKDIKVDNIQSNSDKSISMLLDKEYSVSNIIAIGNNEKLKLKFSQQNRNLIVYGINTLNQEISGKVKFDVYAIVNGEKNRLLFENAKNVSFRDRHFDIILGTNDTEYFYFSKKYRRLMIQTIVDKRIKINHIWPKNHQIFIQSNDFAKLSDNFGVGVKRYNFQEAIDYERLDSITIRLSTDKSSNLNSLVGYDIIFFNDKEPQKDLVAVDITTNKPIQIGKSTDEKIYPFTLSSDALVNSIEIIGEVNKKLLLTSMVDVLGVYLRYRERPVYKNIDFSQTNSDNELLVEFNLSQVINTFSSIEILHIQNNHLIRSVQPLSSLKTTVITEAHERKPDIRGTILQDRVLGD